MTTTWVIGVVGGTRLRGRAVVGADVVDTSARAPSSDAANARRVMEFTRRPAVRIIRGATSFGSVGLFGTFGNNRCANVSNLLAKVRDSRRNAGQKTFVTKLRVIKAYQ